MIHNFDNLFFTFRDYDSEIESKIKSLDICNKKLFKSLQNFLNQKFEKIDNNKLNNFFDILNNLNYDDTYKGYLTHPIRLTYSYINNLKKPSFDDVSLALCHNIIEIGFENLMRKYPQLISNEVWKNIKILTIKRSRSQEESYLNYYYDSINRDPKLMLLKTLDKLDNTLWWVKLDHIKPYDSMVVKEYVCPRVMDKHPTLAKYLYDLTDYVLDKNVRLSFSMSKL